MTAEQRRIVARFKRLVRDAKAADLFLSVDVHAWGLRFIPAEVERAAEDLGTVGECVEFPEGDHRSREGEVTVGVDSCCGTPVPGSMSGNR